MNINFCIYIYIYIKHNNALIHYKYKAFAKFFKHCPWIVIITISYYN